MTKLKIKAPWRFELFKTVQVEEIDFIEYFLESTLGIASESCEWLNSIFGRTPIAWGTSANDIQGKQTLKQVKRFGLSSKQKERERERAIQALSEKMNFICKACF